MTAKNSELPFGISRTKRLTCSTAEDILYKEFRVFDQGFVRLVDYMGGDDSVVYAATGGKGLDLVNNINNYDLFNYLHMSEMKDPFDFVQVKLHMEIPISNALFWVYRKQFRINEYSGRYSVMINKMQRYNRYVISHLDTEKRLSNKKIEEIADKITQIQDNSRENYDYLIEKDFARELSRIGLPLSNYTAFYLSASLNDLLDAVNLSRKRYRNNPDLSIVGDAVDDIIENIAPLVTHSYWHQRERNNAEHLEKHLDLKVNYDLLEKNPEYDQKGRFGISDTKRLTVPEAEEILFKPELFLGNSWFMPTDYMGSDSSIVQSARVSYGAGTKDVSTDKTLIRYLKRHKHTTPFEHVSLQFEAKTPIFNSPRQCLRHRTMNREGVLGEFVPLKDWYHVQEEQMREQSSANRQGRGHELDDITKNEIRGSLESVFRNQLKIREEIEDVSMPKFISSEIAGVGFLNLWSANQDLHNAFHFLSLRADKHAQYEIMELANRYMNFVSKVAPIAYQAWLDYEKNSVRINDSEKDLIAKMIREGKTEIPLTWFREKNWTLPDKKTGTETLNREANELTEKIKSILRDEQGNSENE